MSVVAETSPRIFFQARLTPYRSLSRRAFRRIMAAVVIFSLTVSTGLYLAGAWPIFGFMGLDILLVYLAFNVSYRRARISETIELNDRELIVERIGHRGDRRRWSFPPAWLRVELPEPVMPTTPLFLRTHGEVLAIGGFLSPDERRRVAAGLAGALDRWRKAPFSA